MPYMRGDAKREVGDSTDWSVGLEASIKKYEQRVAGDVTSYKRSERCGLCFVAASRGIDCIDCLASSICAGGIFTIDTSEGILQALKNLRKELGPVDCSKRCANFKPIEVERPTDHPNRIFAEDLRVGMVIRRHGVGGRRNLAVILGETDGTFVPALQLLTGYKPVYYDLALTLSGLQPRRQGGWRGGKYHHAGSWVDDAWCEEVT